MLVLRVGYAEMHAPNFVAEAGTSGHREDSWCYEQR